MAAKSKKRFTTAQEVSETRSKAQRKAWKKRKAMALAKSYTVNREELAFGVTDELVKDDIAHKKLREELASNPKTLTGQQKVPVLSVIPPASIIAQATAMRYEAFFAPRVDGSKGYGPYNWRDQPIEAHIYIDAAICHLMQWWDGDEAKLISDDEGRIIGEVSHLAFALATIGILIDARANGTCIDDRPQVRDKVATGMLHSHNIEISHK